MSEKEYMHELLKKDAVRYDMPNEEIIKLLANENEELKQQRDNLLDACKNSPATNMFSLFADFAEECSTKPSMAVYRNRFIGLATFLRSCENRAEKVEAAIAKALPHPE